MILILTVLTVGCKDDTTTEGESEDYDATLQEFIDTYADIVLQSYTDSRDDAEDILVAVTALVDNPSEETHLAAKQAWLNAQETYGQTEVYRFYGGPIDDDDGPEGALNAWPLDESLIDYVNGAVNGDNADDNVGTNIINSPDVVPNITKDVIASYNEEGGETNISTGYHAVEFLLWGQDEDLGPGGGNRSYTDYLTNGTGTNDNQDRRGDYLKAAAGLIVDDLNTLIEEWKVGGSYRSTFTAADQLKTSLQDILIGMGKLSVGELAGERLEVSLALQSIEDEHSCFSDNTHRDVVTNAQGIENVYLGSYGSISGTGLYALVDIVDSDLAEKLRAEIRKSVSLSELIEAPFEEEIFSTDGGQDRIKAVIDALEAQGDTMVDVAAALGLETLDTSV